MYLEYFGLAERPFSIAPDPHYLYMSARHKEAMAHLTYGLSQGGCFIVLTGEVGTGKTTLCRNLLGNLPDHVEVALILNANINEQELLQSVCDELRIAYREPDSQKKLLDKINAHLLAEFAENRQTVLIIDEAQLLSRDVLEQIRLLTNLETTKSKLLQIILIGQPELNEVLGRNDLRQLAQRVTARYHLSALEPSEIEDYVNFRLRVAGCGKPLFTKQALTQLHRFTEGIPRRINVLADHALLATYSKTEPLVDAKNIKVAANEVFIQHTKPTIMKTAQFRWGVAIVSLLLINALLWWWFVASPMVARPIVEQGENNGYPRKNSHDVSKEGLESANIDDLIAEVDKENGDGLMLSPGFNIETTIIKSDDIAPGSVVIADEPLDELELFTQQSSPIKQAEPRVYNYNAGSELGKVLEASADLTGRIAAFRALAAAWDVDLPKQLIQPACEFLKRNGVECLGVSSWAQLKRFNRPTILVLDQNNVLHRVIVFKVGNDVAQVLVGQNVLDVSVSELRSRWTHNGIIFWRPSEAGNKFLQRGDIDDQLPVVRKSLNLALSELGLPRIDNVESNAFDLPLAQSVFALQSRYSLSVDSKIGNETYLLMNEALLIEETPVLRQRVQ